LSYCFDAKSAAIVWLSSSTITGLEVQDAAQWLAPQEATVPQKTERGNQPAPKEYKEFDPATFASKLVYPDAVKAPGLSKDDATRLGIGWHPQRKAVYFHQKDDTGFIAGLIACRDGKLVTPKRSSQHDSDEFHRRILLVERNTNRDN
jgi:hypothetical protein